MTATGELDSLLPMTNAQLLDCCQFAIHTALLIEEEFGLTESPERPALLAELIAAFESMDAVDRSNPQPSAEGRFPAHRSDSPWME